jgi:CheY-like chemotaxis protein
LNIPSVGQPTSRVAELFIWRAGSHCVKNATANSNVITTARARETILVVMDEILARMVIADYLRQCGYRVIEAATADEAIVALEHKDASVDIVFTTVEMPGTRDGFELSRWVHQHRPGMKVVLAGSLARAASSAGELCDQGPHKKRPYETGSVVAQVNQLLSAVRRQRGRTGL